MANIASSQTPTSLKVRLREPVNEKQARYFASLKNRMCIRSGRRGAKTVGCARRSVERFMKGRRQLYAAPTSDQVGTYWGEVVWALQELIDAKLLVKNETENTIQWAAGMNPFLKDGEKDTARIKAKTAYNADMLRGDYADDLYLDEFQLMDERVWEEVGAPMLMDSNGTCTFVYTPPSLLSRARSKALNKLHAAELYKAFELGYRSREEWVQMGRPKTPNPKPSPNVEVYHWTSFDNPTISAEAVEEIAAGMSALARRQEIMAEDLEEVPGALWSLKLLDANRLFREPDEYKRIVVAVDPASTAKNGSDETGITVAGSALCNCKDEEKEKEQDHIFVLEDKSGRYAPSKWAELAVNAYDDNEADCIVVETNNGGDMVEETIRNYLSMSGRDPRSVHIKRIHAKRGKALRAEPVVALDEKGHIHHVGYLSALEDQMINFTGPDSVHDDRVDARVYACNELSAGITKPKVFMGGWTRR